MEGKEEERDILREALYDAIGILGKSDDASVRFRIYMLIRQCMINETDFCVPIVFRPISPDSEGYNALYDYVDQDTFSGRPYILRPACDVGTDSFMAFLYEKELRQVFPDSPYIWLTLQDLCQELMQTDTVEGLCIVAGDSEFEMSTDELIALTIMQIPSRGHDD